MKHGLLALLAVGALAVAMPASAQYIYLDVNGDGACTTDDVLTPSVTSVDVWIDTNNNANGSVAACSDGTSAMTINSYTFILTAPTGNVTYGAWTDLMGFTVNLGGAQAGNDFWLGRGSGTAQAPGNYKLGTLAVTVSATSQLQIASSTTIDPTAITSFGSLCPGNEGDNTLKLGSDFQDACGTAAGVPTQKTTWGKIKDLYR